MTFMHNKYPIEQAFNTWISNYPESYHPLDMERFYIFVKTVCRYSRKPKNGEWLRNKITQSKSGLSKEDIQGYCIRFEELQDFYKATAIRVYDY